MPPRRRIPLVAVLTILAALWAPAPPAGAASPYLEQIPDPGPCDVVVNESNAATTLGRLNDPLTRVICVDPGDYRSLGRLTLRTSGTEAARRYLVFHASDGVLNAVERSEHAIFEEITISGSSWWVVRGLTLQARNPATFAMLSLSGHHNVIDGNLVDASQLANKGGHAGILISALANRDPATFNVVQRNVVHSGNQSRLPVDYVAVALVPGLELGADLDFNRIVDNELYDWGDGVAIAGGNACDFPGPGLARGTVIDGNDVYVTAAKRVACGDATPDPEGACSCAETGIDIKADAGPDPQLWTRVTNNRLWGFRPVPTVHSCGGQGTFGQAIAAGNLCPGGVLVAGNVVLDSPVGVAIAGPDWIVAGNLFHEIRGVTIDRPLAPVAIFGVPTATDLDIEFNTIVASDNAYDDTSADTNTRCNAVIDNLGLQGNAGSRGSGQSTEYNFLYESAVHNFLGSTNQVYPAASDSGNRELCFWRKRLTTPERICVPLGRASQESPHVAAVAHCDAELATAFGLAPFSYDSVQAVPEPGETGRAVAALLGLAVLAGSARRASAVRG